MGGTKRLFEEVEMARERAKEMGCPGWLAQVPLAVLSMSNALRMAGVTDKRTVRTACTVLRDHSAENGES